MFETTGFQANLVFTRKAGAYPSAAPQGAQLEWDLYYKTLRIRNLQKNDNFRSKQASSDLDRHTSLLRTPYITDPLCFNSTSHWSYPQI